jgi:hypothetical protein
MENETSSNAVIPGNFLVTFLNSRMTSSLMTRSFCPVGRGLPFYDTIINKKALLHDLHQDGNLPTRSVEKGRKV